jgi:hypothetical protein
MRFYMHASTSACAVPQPQRANPIIQTLKTQDILLHLVALSRFPDIRNDYQRSEIALDFNAGFTAAAAGLASLDKARKTRTCSNTGTGTTQHLVLTQYRCMGT